AGARDPTHRCASARADGARGRCGAAWTRGVSAARGGDAMKATLSRRDQLRAQLADLKMPGALEALDDILAGLDGGTLTAQAALDALLQAQITLRNHRRLD